MNLSFLPGDRRSWIRLLLGVVLLIAILLAIRWLRETPGGVSLIPQEVMVNYVPADFDFELDEEYALAVLTHPYRYRHEFDQLVRNINEALIDHTASRMGLPDSIRLRALAAYQEHHTYLSDLYFQDFLALSDTSARFAETWYESANTGAVDIFTEVASKYTCFLTSHVISTAMGVTGGRLMATGREVRTPCSVALREGLSPMMKRLRDRAAITDFTESRGLLQEKVERLIAELATLEIRDKKGLNKQLQTEVMGLRVSTTDITITAVSVLKIGFDLNEHLELELDRGRRELTIVLPEPRILSHEVYPRLENLSIGWLRELQKEDLNRGFNALRGEFRREALESGAFERAKEQAEDVMGTLFAPLVAGIDPKMKIRVAYRKASPPAEDAQIEWND